jgi:peptidoglycan DL-endopeptidase CwlO
MVKHLSHKWNSRVRFSQLYTLFSFLPNCPRQTALYCGIPTNGWTPFKTGTSLTVMRMWCNGSTIAFQAISEGSSPFVRSTRMKGEFVSGKVKRIVIFLLTFTFLFNSINVAYAETIADKRKRIATIKKEIEQLDSSLEELIEDYNAAKIEYDTINAGIKKKEEYIRQKENEITQLQAELNDHTEYLYKTDQHKFISILIEANNVSDFISRWEFMKAMAERQADAANSLEMSIFEASKAKQELLIEKHLSETVLHNMNMKKRTIELKIENRKSIIRGIESSILRSLGSSRRAYPVSAIMPVTGGRPEIIYIAVKELGDPYVWAAAGPNSFDCSGLTMYVYNKVGINLPHNAAMQYATIEKHISKSELQPGDLVFFGSPIHHVGIYAGGGLMIHAPHTGEVVKITALNPNYTGGARP